VTAPDVFLEHLSCLLFCSLCPIQCFQLSRPALTSTLYLITMQCHSFDCWSCTAKKGLLASGRSWRLSGSYAQEWDSQLLLVLFKINPPTILSSSQCSHLSGTWQKSRHRGSAVLAMTMLVAACPVVLFTHQMPAMSQQTPHQFCQGHTLHYGFLSAEKEPGCIGTGSPNTSESCYNQSITSTAQDGVMQTQS